MTYQRNLTKIPGNEKERGDYAPRRNRIKRVRYKKTNTKIALVLEDRSSIHLVFTGQPPVTAVKY